MTTTGVSRNINAVYHASPSTSCWGCCTPRCCHLHRGHPTAAGAAQVWHQANTGSGRCHSTQAAAAAHKETQACAECEMLQERHAVPYHCQPGGAKPRTATTHDPRDCTCTFLLHCSTGAIFNALHPTSILLMSVHCVQLLAFPAASHNCTQPLLADAACTLLDCCCGLEAAASTRPC